MNESVEEETAERGSRRRRFRGWIVLPVISVAVGVAAAIVWGAVAERYGVTPFLTVTAPTQFRTGDGVTAPRVVAIAFVVVLGCVAALLLSAAVAFGRRGWDIPTIGMVVLLAFYLCCAAPLGFFAIAFSGDGGYTTLEGDTGGRDLVAYENAPDRRLYERHGDTLELVGYLGADDLYAPFHDGAYRVRSDGDAVIVQWAFVDSGGAATAWIRIDDASAVEARAGRVPVMQTGDPPPG
ncbi:hypothetical protein [Schumannella sp. 10F1B-5-1]|uniref:hypothetical protein n=1 Tax=Schumannella sp. 10F1B-5-1 TaxID=2590780 RepID=UPI00113164B6|nr:hypothetical protein [Schumannella sp. 10F1B-5-1]TPW76717.1 hypothetical protein FJ658_01885 [Schumannella sp. 10F1B-5-1]